MFNPFRINSLHPSKRPLKNCFQSRKLTLGYLNNHYSFTSITKHLQGKLYNKFKSTCNPFHFERYRKMRSYKKAFQTLMEKLVFESVCKATVNFILNFK